ncbi:tubulin epsilon and delta complex protein 1 [Echeneis naucrates]|uniref:tubulin epsilon and delta complex protein 1 n=1 Tax=Echeneis naucrates TaxID=173247 RepID=UPI0011139533|nr:tubulin epsilon and delta complex protein 1 [Echeneis naucrates]
MRRSKASVSVEVKKVVGALCRLLAATGLNAVPTPETFRRAKFGEGVDVESQFWLLLANILQKTGVISSETSTQLPEDLRKLVAAGLWQTGFYANWMHVKEDGEEEEGTSFSSRDLLLALGWLLAAGTLEKLLTQRVQQLDKTLLTSISVNIQVSHELHSDSASLRKLQWLVGCLRHQRRILCFMLEERARLLHAVFSASPATTVSSDHSSTVLQSDCVRMQQLCDLLEAYLNWKQEEKVFWTWMDSVLDCHLIDPVGKKSTYTPSMFQDRNQGQDKLDEIPLRLPTTQEGQRRGREDTEDRVVFPLPSLPTLLQTHRIQLQVGKPVGHMMHSAERLHGREEAQDELSASQAVELLLQIEAVLLERRDKQRLANRMQMEEMIAELNELVLIPPLTFSV